MADNDLLLIISQGNETRRIEYKETLNWQLPEHKAKITKSLLALSNLQDGGYLVLGVKQENNIFIPCGMPIDDYNLITQDHVAAHVYNFADPYIDFKTHNVIEDGKYFVVFEVFEFEEIPTICKKDGVEGLRCGAIYNRSRRIPETTEIRSHIEMRELIELTVEKGIRKMHERLTRIGLDINIKTTEQDQFEEELEEL